MMIEAVIEVRELMKFAIAEKERLKREEMMPPWHR